jgi:ribonuclease BN (tRNA processing enzyme)
MKKTHIQFLGTGNGLFNDPGNYHSILTVTHGKDRLFIDCGSDFQHALYAAGLTHTDVKHLYISHIHSDHAGGLEWLGFANAFYGAGSRIRLYCVDEVHHNLNAMLTPSMKASIQTMNLYGIAACFNVQSANKGFKVGAIKCTPIKTLHVNAFDNLYSYGLFIEIGVKSILFTSDTQFNPDLFMPYYEKADIILHDCSTSPVKYPAHAHITELGSLSDSIKQKMYLYHYGPGRPSINHLGFKGYAVPREEIIL